MSESKTGPKSLRGLLGRSDWSWRAAPRRDAAVPDDEIETTIDEALPATDPEPGVRDKLPNVPSPQLGGTLPQPATTRLHQVSRRAGGGLPPLPTSTRPRHRGTLLSFILLVLLPTAFGAYYYTYIASKQYM